ncbi:unnamed protein product [Symbiodinium sp. CCMP2592]|nr:unnamed protein product [Symbiodinium sp. CCMP2592]
MESEPIDPETRLVEENTPAALAISDTFVQAQQVSFTDLDLDVSQFGGNLTWQQPSLDTSLITHYMVYFGLDAAGLDNRYLFTYVPQPFSEIAVPAETSLYHPSYFGPGNTSMLFNYILVYARSSLAEQTTPAYVGIIDSDMPVNDVFWVGEDLDINDLQGTLQWTPPENISGEVITQPDFNFLLASSSRYAVYLADAGDGGNRLLVNWTGYNDTELEELGALSYVEMGEVPYGTNSFQVPAGTVRSSYSHFLVYSRSVGASGGAEGLLHARKSLVMTVVMLVVGVNFAVVRWSPASETLAEASTPAFLSFAGAALNASVTEVNFTDDAAALHTVQLASLGCLGKVFETKEGPTQFPTSSTSFLKPTEGPESLGHMPSPITDVHFAMVPMARNLGIATLLDLVHVKAMLSELLEGSKPHLKEALQAALRCFPDDYPFDYRKCCRDPGNAWFRKNVEKQCWAVQSGITFEKCCTFKFGPKLRGLPYASHADPSAPTEFDLPVGRLILRSGFEEALGDFWPPGWIFAKLTADLPRAVQDSEAFGWETGAQMLRPLLEFRALRIFDVSCGLGLSSITAARAGHNVTATEMSLDLLRMAGQNAKRNGARVRLQRWDFFRAAHGGWRSFPSEPKAYDLCFVDVGWANVRFREFQMGRGSEMPASAWAAWPSVEKVLKGALLHLQQLGGCRLHAFVAASQVVSEEGFYVDGHFGFANFTLELLQSLAKFATALEGRTRPRWPAVSPLGFLEKDLDLGDLGGELVWTKPAVLGKVIGYNIYLGDTDTSGSVRSSLLTAQAASSTSFVMPENVATLTYRYVHINSFSALGGEQTTPVAHEFYDAFANVTDFFWVDRDLDPGEIGGPSTYNPPDYIFRTEYYVLYLAAGPNGEDRSQMGQEVPVGIERADVFVDTPTENWTHLLLYVRSPLFEQTTPQLCESRANRVIYWTELPNTTEVIDQSGSRRLEDEASDGKSDARRLAGSSTTVTDTTPAAKQPQPPVELVQHLDCQQLHAPGRRKQEVYSVSDRDDATATSLSPAHEDVDKHDHEHILDVHEYIVDAHKHIIQCHQHERIKFDVDPHYHEHVIHIFKYIVECHQDKHNKRLLEHHFYFGCSGCICKPFALSRTHTHP